MTDLDSITDIDTMLAKCLEELEQFERERPQQWRFRNWQTQLTCDALLRRRNKLLANNGPISSEYLGDILDKIVK